MDRDFLIDLFADFGPVTIRRMFSGYGISADGINFALALRAGLYFRADEQTIPQYEAEGSKPFQYQTRAKTVTVNSYWQLPARLFDDSGRPRHMGEGGAGCGPARGAEEAAEGAQGGEGRYEEGRAGRTGQARRRRSESEPRPPGPGFRRCIPDRLRRSRGCGRCAWRRRGRHRHARSGRRYRRRASAWRRPPRW